MNRNVICIILFAATLLTTVISILLASPGLCAPNQSGSNKGNALPQSHNSSFTRVEVLKRYKWQDINSVKIIEKKGNRFIVDSTSTPEYCRLETTINKARLKNVIESYGVPESWLQYTYTSEQDRRRKTDEIQGRIARYGLHYSKEGNAINTNYRWMVENSVGDMKRTAICLKGEAERLGYQNVRQLNGLIASFVQSLEYRIPPSTRRTPAGQKVVINGVTMPLETLYYGHGDCDTKTVLFASILKNFKGARVILLHGEKHMFAAIRMEPRMYEYYVRINGEKFVLVELTQPWYLGHVPQKNLHSLKLKKMAVLPFFE